MIHNQLTLKGWVAGFTGMGILIGFIVEIVGPLTCGVLAATAFLAVQWLRNRFLASLGTPSAFFIATMGLLGALGLFGLAFAFLGISALWFCALCGVTFLVSTIIPGRFSNA
jgi:hypothetical protein